MLHRLRRRDSRARYRLLCAALCLSLLGGFAQQAAAKRVVAHEPDAQRSITPRRAEPAIAFGVLTDAPTSIADESSVQALLQGIAASGRVAFTVDLGNVRGADEPCSDALFARRRALLDQAPMPLVYVPGTRDWVDCERPGAGSFDPVERLDALRDSFLAGTQSLGTPSMRVIRQSELPAFTPYRENMRWIDAGVVFATLNVTGANNYFLDGGGRNGEYEDREVANRAWIEHAVTDAKRRHARGLVIFFHADPHFSQSRGTSEAAGSVGSDARRRFDWLFRSARQRDGYSSLRRDLVRSLAGFDGPVLIVHGRDTLSAAAANGTSKIGTQTSQEARASGDATASRGFLVENLTHGPEGTPLHDVRQVFVSGEPGRLRWLRIALPASAIAPPHDARPHARTAPGFRLRMETIVPSEAAANEKTAGSAQAQETLGTSADDGEPMDSAARATVPGAEGDRANDGDRDGAAPAASTSYATSAPAIGTSPDNALLPGELPEPSYAVESDGDPADAMPARTPATLPGAGVRRATTGTEQPQGTSALEGITEPAMLPLPPVDIGNPFQPDARSPAAGTRNTR